MHQVTEPPRLLRRLASLIIRGPEARWVLADLDDTFERDVERGLGRRAVRRYATNAVASAASVAASRLRPSGIRASWLDVKLGTRMLIKYPALTLVAVFALAIGVPVGLAPMQMADAIEAPLPGDADARIRHLRYWSLDRHDPTTMEDVVRWRESLTSFSAIGASRQGAYNLEIDNAPLSVPGAELTASMFGILGVHPAAGRAFTSDDERPGAPNVVIVGHAIAESAREHGATLIGQTVRVGNVPHVVIGEMPEGFGFPWNQQLWLPLRDQVPSVPGQGQPLSVLGRLADGVTPDEAQRELTTVNDALTDERPDASDRRTAEVAPASYMNIELPPGGLQGMPEFYGIQALTLVPLLIACVNVGLLIFARTATRSTEFAIRTALGASRGRILTQVFTESLVLAVIATGAGLLLLEWLPTRVLATLGISLPYWLDPGVSSATLFRAAVLTAAAALIAGVIPVLRMTGRSVHQNIQRAHARRSGTRFGGLSGVLVVTDVAVAVAVIGFAVAIYGRVTATMPNEATDGIRADRYLAVTLRMAGGLDAATEDQLVTRLRAEPGVRGVVVGSALPRMDHRIRFVEVDGEDLPADAIGHHVRSASVGVGFFEGLHQSVRTGRFFQPADLTVQPTAVIVNTNFVKNVLDGGNPIGRRIRYRYRGEAPTGPWYDIVGVVGPLGMHSLTPTQDEGIYHPLIPGTESVLNIAIEREGDPMTFAPRVRDLAREVDPRAVIGSVTTLDRVFEGDWYLMGGVVLGGFVLVGVLLTLAASALYAIMSFTVAERTREIGIRVALGADRLRVAIQVARRALIQIALGVAIGLPVMIRIYFEIQEGTGRDPSVLLAVASALVPGIAIMVIVGLVACVAPTLRALRISPVEALKGDG